MAAFLSTLLCVFFIIFLMVVVLLASGLRNIPQNEQWVVTRLGDTFVRRPGWMMQIPFIDRVVRVDMGEKPLNVQDQTCITSDRAPVIIHMLVYVRIIDPVKFASRLGRDRLDLQNLSSSTLKKMVGTWPLDRLLSGREELGEAICTSLNAQIDPTQDMRIDKVTIMEIVVSREILASTPVPGEFPPECPACGAPLNNSAGQAARQLKCEYCGYLIFPLNK